MGMLEGWNNKKKIPPPAIKSSHLKNLGEAYIYSYKVCVLSCIMVIFLETRVQRKHLMNITTLENGDRSLELSEYELDILVRVITHLRDNYDDLEFAIRDFTVEQAESMLELLKKHHVNHANTLSEDTLFLLFTIIVETPQFLDGVEWYHKNTDTVITMDNIRTQISKNLRAKND